MRKQSQLKRKELENSGKSK